MLNNKLNNKAYCGTSIKNISTIDTNTVKQKKKQTILKYTTSQKKIKSEVQVPQDKSQNSKKKIEPNQEIKNYDSSKLYTNKNLLRSYSHQHQRKLQDMIQKGKYKERQVYIQSEKIQGYCPQKLRYKPPEQQNLIYKQSESNSRQQKIIFQVDHQKVEDLIYPFTAIGLLKSTFFQQTCKGIKPFQTWGTAFLIGPNLLMTAAHNIYSHELNLQAQQFKFYLPGKTPKINLKDAVPYNIKNKIYPNLYASRKNDDLRLPFDYAFVELYERIGETYGWLGLDLNIDPSSIKEREIYLYGYPGEVNAKNGQEFKEFQMCGNKNKVKNCHKKYLTYQISTSKGQSGAPVYYKDKQNYFVIAIHSQQGGKNQEFNKGFLIIKSNLITQILGDDDKLKSTRTEFRLDVTDLDVIPKKEIAETMIIKLPGILEIRLKNLQLSYCHIGIKGIRMIVDASIPLLQRLILNNNQAGKEGAQLLSKGKWPMLVEFKFGSNRIQAQGARHISKGKWDKLNMLYIQNNAIGSEGVQYIIKGQWPLLECLNMEQNNIDAEDARKIINGFGKLKRLKLLQNKMSRQAIINLVREKKIQTD